MIATEGTYATLFSFNEPRVIKPQPSIFSEPETPEIISLSQAGVKFSNNSKLLLTCWVHPVSKTHWILEGVFSVNVCRATHVGWVEGFSLFDRVNFLPISASRIFSFNVGYSLR